MSAQDSHGEVALGVFWVAQSVLDGKNGVILGSRAALALDSGNSPADAQNIADLIRAQGSQPDRLALTHGHGDHVIGSSVFRQAEVSPTPEHQPSCAATCRGWPSTTDGRTWGRS